MSGWQQVFDDASQSWYYWNQTTNETTWDIPEGLSQPPAETTLAKVDLAQLAMQQMKSKRLNTDTEGSRASAEKPETENTTEQDSKPDSVEKDTAQITGSEGWVI
jgi:WW domain